MFGRDIFKKFARACVLGSTALVATPALAQIVPPPPPQPGPGPAPAPAPAPQPVLEAGAIRPYYGTLAPSWGTIAPFSDNVSPLWGTIAPFTGSVAPSWGTIAPFYGAVAPSWGTIAPFYGAIGPYWGTIAPFWGTIAPFWGELSPFWGTIAPFWGSTATTISAPRTDGVTPSWSGIASFWQTAGSDWSGIETAWMNAVGTGVNGNLAGLTPVAGQLNAFVDRSAAFWGAAVTARTGKSFRAGFADAVFARYGIDPNDPASLGKMSAASRTSFMLDWYDGLMEYAGVDHVDHWMRTINWNPALTEIQGDGRRSVIGLLDFAVAGDADIRNNIVAYNGVSNFTNGHGAAVASLMVAAHDGKGVIGIAPMASVVAYNPFDETGTASWADVTRGVAKLAGTGGASIVNMSLGVPGTTLDPGWKSVFTSPSVRPFLKNTVFVTAAGNDGIAQTGTILWDFGADPALIVVGSVDPTNTISSFSNRPGSACLVSGNNACNATNLLKNRFIVAPGELMLVSDDKGGVTRQSGTSFAAPLVSGTIALIHNRWPWLANYPKETVQIVLQSAKDLGPAGVDETYGVGLLDATAANSPLNFNTIQWYTLDKGDLKSVSASKLRDPKEQAKWEAAGAYFYAYEKIGGTYRDFAVPLSSKLVGASVQSADGTWQRFQTYITGRMMDWLKGANNLAGGSPAGGFASFTASAGVANPYGLNLTMSVAPRNPARRPHAGDLPFQSSLRAASPDGQLAFRVGYGDGAVAFADGTGFALFSDHDVETGGVNPLLAMASGGGYAGAELALNSKLTLSAGVSGNDPRRDLDLLSPLDRPIRAGVDKYRTAAQHVSVSYRVDPAVTFNASFTRLDEQAGLLGLQSLDPNDLRDGTTSRSLTLGADIQLAPTLRLSGSGTIGRTGRGDPTRQNLAVGSGGLVTSAYQVALNADHLLDRSDRLRVTLSQPMHLEKGAIDVTTVRVIDRQTGELGSFTQSFDISGGPRRYVAELLYGRALGPSSEMSLFGRANLRPVATGTEGADYIAGGRYSLSF